MGKIKKLKGNYFRKGDLVTYGKENAIVVSNTSYELRTIREDIFIKYCKIGEALEEVSKDKNLYFKEYANIYISSSKQVVQVHTKELIKKAKTVKIKITFNRKDGQKYSEVTDLQTGVDVLLEDIDIVKTINLELYE